MTVWPLIAAMLVCGCAQLQGQPQASSGPPSLQLVPASFYSREPPHQPGPRPGPDAAPKRVQKRSADDGTITVVVPEPESEPEQEVEGSSVPPDTAKRIEEINDQLQQLRRTIARPKKPPL